MRTIVALTVFSLFFFATARCVDAGVMLGESPTVISQCTAPMMVNLTPFQEEEQQRCSFRQSESSGLSGSSINTVQTVGQSATAHPQLLPVAPSVVERLYVVNDARPHSPFLEKPPKPA